MLGAGSYGGSSGGDSGGYSQDMPMEIEMGSYSGSMMGKERMENYGASNRDYLYEDFGGEFASSNVQPSTATPSKDDQSDQFVGY